MMIFTPNQRDSTSGDATEVQAEELKKEGESHGEEVSWFLQMLHHIALLNLMS